MPALEVLDLGGGDSRTSWGNSALASGLVRASGMGRGDCCDMKQSDDFVFVCNGDNERPSARIWEYGVAMAPGSCCQRGAADRHRKLGIMGGFSLSVAREGGGADPKKGHSDTETCDVEGLAKSAAEANKGSCTHFAVEPMTVKGFCAVGN